jgi:hypothetical protein
LKVIIMGTAGPSVVCGKKALNRRVSAISGQENYRLHCSTGQSASAAASKQQGDIAPPLKNASVKPSEAPKEMAEDCVELQMVVRSAYR